MVILRTRNKITDFLMILAWASPFNANSTRYRNNNPLTILQIYLNPLAVYIAADNIVDFTFDCFISL